MKLTIKSKLYLSFSAILVLPITVGIYSIISLNQVNQKLTEIASNLEPRIDLTLTWQSTFRLNENYYLLDKTMTLSQKSEFEKQMIQMIEELDSVSKELTTYIPENRKDKRQETLKNGISILRCIKKWLR